MTERLRSASTVGHHCPKMENDLSPRKTMLVVVIVVGCFAVLWPKVFYPMLVGSANQHIKPSPIDKTTGCCDVISETDVNTIKIMTELCGTIIKAAEDKPLTGKEIVQRCRQEVLDTCGIDISVVLQEQVRLGQTVKQILDEIRSLNGSLCLKYNYGVAPWRLGVPHRITTKTASDASNIRQERPMHLRSELVHPAFRERGRAIPQPQVASPSRPPPRVVEGRPGPIPGMRPTMGGAGHVVPPSKQGTSSMSVIMPIYTIGIVIFFTYTLMKIVFKKQPENVGGSLYPQVDPDPHFRKEVFESESSRLGPRLTRENISSKLVVNAMSALLDEVDQEIEARRKSSEVASQDLVNGTLSNGDAVKPQDEEQPTVKVLGMEMTASCEGGKKWSRPESPVLPTSPPPPPAEPVPPPQEIYLEGALPAQSHLLVADSAIEPEPTTGEDPAVVLSGKMTLSVISLDSENGVEETVDGAEDVNVGAQITTNGHEVQESSAESAKAKFSMEEVSPRHETEKPEVKQSIEEYREPVTETPQDISEIDIDNKNLAKFDETREPVSEATKDNSDNKDLAKFDETAEDQTTPTNIHDTTVQLIQELLKEEDSPITPEDAGFSIEEETEKLIANLGDDSAQSSLLEQQIQEFLQKLNEPSGFQAPAITLDSEDVPHTVEVESLGKELDDLLQEAIDNVQQQQATGELLPTPSEPTNEIKDDVNETKIEQIPELKQEISGEIARLIREVKDLPAVEKLQEDAPVVEEKRPDRQESNRHSEIKDVPVIADKSQDNDETNTIEESINQLDEKPNIDVGKLKVAEETQALSNKVDEISQRIEEITSRIGEASSQAESQLKEVEETVSKQEFADVEASKLPIDAQIEATPVEVEEKTSSNNEIQETATVTRSEDTEENKVKENLSTSSEAILKVEEKNDSAEIQIVPAQPSSNEPEVLKVDTIEEDKSKSNQSEDEELASDEELVEEIEEIVYEEESGEEEEIEIEVEEEESEDEIPNERNTNRTESSSAPRVNGERSEDLVESKYTTVSGATAAENDISDEDLIDNEDVEEEEEEIIEVEEEVEEEEYVNDEGNDVNHISGDSEAEL